MVSATNSFDEVTVLIRNRIASEVKNIYNRNNNLIDVKTVTFSWPEEEKTDNSKFPFIVIQNEDADDIEFNYDKEEISNRLNIEVASLNNDEASKIISKCYDAIKTYKGQLRELGITEIRLIDKDSENDEFGALRVRRMSITFEMRWKRSAW